MGYSRIMKIKLWLAMAFFSVFPLTGCVSKEAQRENPSAGAQNIPEETIPTAQSKSGENEQFQLDIIPAGITKVKQCIMQVLQGRGETIAISPEKANEITTQMKFVSLDKLQTIADISTQQDKIRWEKGGYNIHITMETETDTSTKILITLRIIGYFETSLPLFRPSTWERIPSKGVLEQEIYNAISDCCKIKE